MLPTTTPDYDYEKNAGRKVIIRLVQSLADRHTYYLQFRTEGCSLFNRWHFVREYIPTASSNYRPGIPGRYNGNWYPLSVRIYSDKDGNDMLAELKESLTTAGDIYKCFIMSGIARMKEDMKTYERTQNHNKSLPKMFI